VGDRHIADSEVGVIQSLRHLGKGLDDAMAWTAQTIVQDITRRIRDGEWKRGEKLPTTNELAAYYEVHPNTINVAMKILIDRRTVEGRQGGGRFVP